MCGGVRGWVALHGCVCVCARARVEANWAVRAVRSVRAAGCAGRGVCRPRAAGWARLHAELLRHPSVLEEDLLGGGVEALDRLLLGALLHLRKHLLVLLRQPPLLLEELALDRREHLLVVRFQVGPLEVAPLELLLETRLLLLERLQRVKLVSQVVQLRLHLRLLRTPLGLLLLEGVCSLLSLLLALLREEVALLIDRVLERLDQLVLALRIAPQKGDDLKGIGLPLVLLHLERIVLAAQVLAAQLVLVERATPRVELYSLHIIADHANASCGGSPRSRPTAQARSTSAPCVWRPSAQQLSVWFASYLPWSPEHGSK